MIQYYQELLNECIDLQEHHRILHILKEISKKMKGVNKDARIRRNSEIKG